MDILQMVLVSAVIGFTVRYVSQFIDNICSYTMIFGFIRFRIAKFLEPAYIDSLTENMPEDFEQWPDWMKEGYYEICKKHFWFHGLNCQYCISIWALIFICILYAPLMVVPGAYYFLTSLAFLHVVFRL